MHRPRTRRALLALASLTLALGAGLTACGESDIGKVCNSKEDCSGDLICDVHDGKGTCQEPHGHESATGTGDGGTTTDAATDTATEGTTDASTTHDTDHDTDHMH